MNVDPGGVIEVPFLHADLKPGQRHHDFTLQRGSVSSSRQMQPSRRDIFKIGYGLFSNPFFMHLHKSGLQSKKHAHQRRA